MADDLRAALESAISGEPNETPPNDATATDSGTADSEGGAREVPPEPDTEHTPGDNKEEAPLQPDNKTNIEQVAGAKPGEPGAKQEEAHPDDPLGRAPQSWKGGAKQLWKDLPLPVRLEVNRRERDTSRVLQESSLNNRKVAEITQVLAPHMDRINQQYGGNPIAAIHNLFQAEHNLTRAAPMDRARFVADMIRNYQVDINMLDEILAGSGVMPQNNQPTMQIEQILDQRLRPVMSFIERQEQAAQEQASRAEQVMNTTIDAMEADYDTYPHFQDVRQDMALVIEAEAKKGVYIDLPAAYNKAVRLNDLAPSSGGANTQTDAALRKHQEAQKARGASRSVSGAPGSMNGTSRVDPKDLRGTIEALVSGGGGSRL